MTSELPTDKARLIQSSTEKARNYIQVQNNLHFTSGITKCIHNAKRLQI